MDHDEFERVLTTWFAQFGLQEGEAIAVDGKTLRGIHGEEVPGVHLVAAFAHQTRLVLTQAATVGKGNELKGVKQAIAALPAHLIAGHLITGDAARAKADRIFSQKRDTAKSAYYASNQGKVAFAQFNEAVHKADDERYDTYDDIALRDVLLELASLLRNFASQSNQHMTDENYERFVSTFASLKEANIPHKDNPLTGDIVHFSYDKPGHDRIIHVAQVWLFMASGIRRNVDQLFENFRQDPGHPTYCPSLWLVDATVESLGDPLVL
jgi:hypothetical protein